MKTIHKVSLAVAIMGLIAMPLSAQPGQGQGNGYGKGHHHHMPDSSQIQRKVADMGQAVGLSAAQEATILQLHYDHLEERKAMRVKHKSECAARWEAREEARKTFEASIEEQLTEEQLGKYKAYRQACKKGSHKGHGQKRK